MSETIRCECGARVVGLDEIKTGSQYLFVYTCGECGKQLEIKDAPC